MNQIDEKFGEEKQNADNYHPFEILFARSWTWKEFCNYRYRNFKKDSRKEFRAIFSVGLAVGIVSTLFVIGLIYLGQIQ